MPDIILRAFALIGALTVGYHLEMLSRRLADRASRRALSVQPKGEGGGDG